MSKELYTYRFRVSCTNGSTVIDISVPLGRTDKAFSELLKVLNAREKANSGCGITRVTKIERTN